MLSHAEGPLHWHDLPAAWSLEPLVWVSVAACWLAYREGTRRPGPRLRQGGWGVVATVSVLLALVSPVDTAAAALFSAHMFQHITLIFVLAPALALWRPWRAWQRLVPRTMRRRVAAGLRRSGAAARGIAGRLAVSTSLAIAVLWAWHVPSLYDATLRNALLHDVEHASLVVSWTWLWCECRRAVRRGAAPLALGSLAAVSVSGTALGGLLVFTPDRWYAVRPGSAALGVQPMADQRLAGALMSVGSGLLVIGAFAWTFLRIVAPDARPSHGHVQHDRERRAEEHREEQDAVPADVR